MLDGQIQNLFWSVAYAGCTINSRLMKLQCALLSECNTSDAERYSTGLVVHLYSYNTPQGGGDHVVLVFSNSYNSYVIHCVLDCMFLCTVWDMQ